jgi:tetratricopeptide (TPR) repeat protein
MPEAWFYRGQVHAQKGEYEAAVVDFTKAIELAPEQAPGQVAARFCRGQVYAQKGEYDQAIADFTEAIRLDPAQAVGHNNLAWLLATCPEAAVRDGPKAVENATRACELSEWADSHCLGTLAAAHAEVGQFEQAVECQVKAIEAPTPDYDRDAARMRLELYRAGKPYRQEPNT